MAMEGYEAMQIFIAVSVSSFQPTNYVIFNSDQRNPRIKTPYPPYIRWKRWFGGTLIPRQIVQSDHIACRDPAFHSVVPRQVNKKLFRCTGTIHLQGLSVYPESRREGPPFSPPAGVHDHRPCADPLSGTESE